MSRTALVRSILYISGPGPTVRRAELATADLFTMSNIAVRASNRSQSHQLGVQQTRYSTLRDRAARRAASSLRWLRSRRTTSANNAEVERKLWALQTVSFEVEPGETRVLLAGEDAVSQSGGWSAARIGGVPIDSNATISLGEAIEALACFHLARDLAAANPFCIIEDGLGHSIVHKRFDAATVSGNNGFGFGRYAARVEFAAL